MKVGILTFHWAHNYGAVLQAYALEKYLSEQGHEVEIINHIPAFAKNAYKKSIWKSLISKRHPLSSISKLYKESRIYKLREKRWEGFNSFINNRLNLSEKADVISDKYDAYIVGSDQVWNPKITHGLYPQYFCDFPFEKKNKVYISYAASSELKNITSEEKNKFIYYLQKFDCIGVRETALLRLLQPLTRTQICLTLDPTLVVDKDVFSCLTVNNDYRDKRYVLIYRVWDNQNIRRIAEIVAKKCDAEIIELVSWIDSHTCDNTFQAASPEEFVSLFKSAIYVITDSFHGTAFSLIYNKSFFFVKVNDAQSRSESLLRLLGIEDRVLRKDCDLTDDKEIDYIKVNIELEKLRKDSIGFIDAALSRFVG